jgi:aminopeptidase N
MEEFTGIPYPFAKYDFIILPGFQYGGMEHTGATLYNDTRMFLSKNPTPDEELGRAELIAHETAHMWFGDFVTMEWFNDVWTKEVFANYFAQRITEPMFPGINHRLNWLKSITTSALVEDRTQGGTSIRQPLDNMRNAGLVYNNIIYNKAPVMLEKLVELMGEEAFREGIH